MPAQGPDLHSLQTALSSLARRLDRLERRPAPASGVSLLGYVEIAMTFTSAIPVGTGSTFPATTEFQDAHGAHGLQDDGTVQPGYGSVAAGLYYTEWELPITLGSGDAAAVHRIEGHSAFGLADETFITPDGAYAVIRMPVSRLMSSSPGDLLWVRFWSTDPTATFIIGAAPRIRVSRYAVPA